MGLIDILKTEYVSIIAGAIGGVITAWITNRMLNKRGLFSYYVNHNRVGVTAEDAVFGKVTALWNGNQIPNLYISNVELTNESMNDYENVAIQVYTSDTKLLSEQTQVLDSPNILEWSDRYRQQLHVQPESEPTVAQWSIYYGQREYVVPVFNRGQVIRLTYLNSANGSSAPSIWMSVTRKGVKLKFRVPQPLFLGVPRPRAAVVGIVVCTIVVVGLLFTSIPQWVVALVALALGLFAQLPGAYAVRLWRKLYNAIGG